ncbi:hypothetical protein EDEG_02644 [Edhazardia aedis USNM 41457]|uniref:Uncharacterized protein n=1 Tax=Edhazardia aedis (strain USNM 41457) TaxID=1003232 RepID=J9DK64_EDHAE|nr:hypothetical protein EDEG_02644 [Edhazardia aedis USNM 41457]|eukprot:EJW03000.1 hypothetical protein EDEG_02644 [Edhazardia aedis USNM 41457]
MLKNCEKKICKTLEKWDKIYIDYPDKFTLLYEPCDLIKNAEQNKLDDNSTEESDSDIKVCFKCFKLFSREILANLWNHEVVLKLLNDQFVPAIKQILHNNIDLSEPFDIKYHLKNKIKKKELFKPCNLSLISLINSLLNFGFTFDNFFCSNHLPLKFDTVISDNSKDFILIFGSFGMLRKNSYIKFSLFDFFDDGESGRIVNYLEKYKNPNINCFIDYLEFEEISYDPKKQN